MARPLRSLSIIAAFAAIYLVWGSTYLAIRVGLETLPPFLLAAARFLVAGGGLYAVLRLTGSARPSDRQWWWASATGILMLVGGTGGVTWGEQLVASGPACLLVTTVPLWMTFLDAIAVQRRAPGARVMIGLGLGLAGVAVLVGGDVEGVEPLGALVILGAALSWSVGSLLTRSAHLPDSPLMTVAVQNLVAGGVLVVLSGGTGEWRHLDPAAISGRSLAALAYLVVFGSLVAFSAYLWLLQRVPAPAVATYAFVNPVVAVLLGWGLGGEAVSNRLMVAMVLIVVAVVTIQARAWAAARRRPRPTVAEATPVATRACPAPPAVVCELPDTEVA